MEAAFWHKRWQTQDTGFHLSDVNPTLVQYINRLHLKKNDHVFVPLCGKTHDIAWLLQQGFHVTGAELSELAIQQLFDEMNVEPEIATVRDLKRYRWGNLTIFVGDLFELTADDIHHVDAVYDRAALIALPEDMRKHYASHLVQITDKAEQLIIIYEYDSSLMQGPPFSVEEDEIHSLYQENYNIERIAFAPLEEKLKGTVTANESVWVMKP